VFVLNIVHGVTEMPKIRHSLM